MRGRKRAMTLSTYLTGLMMGLSLIVAIGAQNAFVLKQGIRREHVLAVVLTCSLSDAVLILLGVTSLKHVLRLMPWLEPTMRYGGAAFLLWYGFRSLTSAIRNESRLTVETGQATPLLPAMMTCLALTWLNPHVYLDTVVLLGTISTHFPGSEMSFALGAMSGSFLFFFALGYGAAFLRPVFSRPAAWRVLDLAIALVMGTIAIRLLAGS